MNNHTAIISSVPKYSVAVIFIITAFTEPITAASVISINVYIDIYMSGFILGKYNDKSDIYTREICLITNICFTSVL